MRLIEELRAEHVLIEQVLGSLRTFVDLRSRGEGDSRDGEGFLRFFRLYSGGYHHAREEDTLFPALEAHLDLPPASGPLFSLLSQHQRMARTLEEMAPLLAGDPSTPGGGEELAELATRYSRDLLQHIDAENSVLLPESEERLRRAGLNELEGRSPNEAEAAAKAEGERLVRRYPPTRDPEALRGEGCVICASYGTTCRGLEREWWTASEWEAFEGSQE